MRLHVVFVRVPEAAIVVIGEEQTAFDVEVGGRDFGDRIGRVSRLGRSLDGTGDGAIEADDVAVEPFGRRVLQFPAHAEVERQLARRLPIIVEEEALIERLVRARGVAVNLAAGGDAQQEGGQLLAAGHTATRIILLPREVVGEIVTPGRVRRGDVVLAVRAEVVAHLKRMGAGDLGQRRLYRVSAEAGRVAYRVAEHIEAADLEARKVGGVSEERSCRRRETERGRIEFTLMLPNALLDEARKADARI